VRASHERWDGAGYPDGHAGHEIPLGARIVAVCDAFDALTAERPYRAARSRAIALDELRRCAGTQFDPRVVAAFAAALQTQDAVTAHGRPGPASAPLSLRDPEVAPGRLTGARGYHRRLDVCRRYGTEFAAARERRAHARHGRQPGGT
jgi:hypothetical protein